ncbi:hypothetical protein [Haloferax sp. YSMS24]|uniref:hypothetical protein n=1 Tax=Haloferax sp. YSMS24 TaxID=3388425 RepID=UPI00398D5480
MNALLKFVGSALVASVLAAVLSLFVFQMPVSSATQTALLAAAVAFVIVYLNTRQSDSPTEAR